MPTNPTLINVGPNLATTGMVHRLQRPVRPGPHPTVIMLHGRSGNEDVMWIFARALPPGWLAVAPRAILPDPEGGFSWRLRSAQEWPALPQFDEPVGRLMRFMGALPALYDADPARIYLMGFSQGAALAYATAMRHPGRLQGIAGLVGFVPTGVGDVSRQRPLQNLPIFMAVGKEDPLIPHELAIACAQTLQAAGGDLEYHEYATGHKLNRAGMDDLKAWWAEREQARR